MSIVASDFILVELGNGDSSKDADDGNDNQQFYEGEAFCSLMSWMFLDNYSPQNYFIMIISSKHLINTWSEVRV